MTIFMDYTDLNQSHRRGTNVVMANKDNQQERHVLSTTQYNPAGKDKASREEVVGKRYKILLSSRILYKSYKTNRTRRNTDRNPITSY